MFPFFKKLLAFFLVDTSTKRKGINCVIRIGLPGSGKTLDQTERDVLPNLIKGEKVFCSYWLNWALPNYQFFSSFDEVEHERNCHVVFDEIGQILPARDWEKEGIRVQMFFQLHRHRHVDIVANTQDISLVAKTVGIVASSWIFCQNVNVWFWDFFRKIFFFSHRVDIFKADLSYQQLKKMTNGWELDTILENEEVQKKRKSYSIKNIIHHELDDFKIELVHKYCSECAMRQGSQILKADTLNICDYNKKKDKYILKVPEFCPIHKKTLLIVRQSGMYDTDYEPIIEEKEVIFVPMAKVQETKMAKYTGRLTDNQRATQKALEKTI